MSLGENIYRLRSEKRMSQDGLAEALKVSRQSVSKWENNLSVPDLDKLLKMSQLFGVTLDALVNDSQPQTPPPAPDQVPPAEASLGSTQRTWGIVLFCCGLAVLVLLSLMGGFLTGLLLSAPLLVPGLICLLCKKRAGLKCAWAEFLIIALFLSVTTGTNWSTLFAYIRMWGFFREYGNIVHPIISGVEILCLVGLWIWTIRSYNSDGKPLSPRGILLLCLGWVVYVLGMLPYQLPIDVLSQAYGIVVNLISFGRLGLLTVLLVFNWRLYLQLRRKRN